MALLSDDDVFGSAGKPSLLSDDDVFGSPKKESPGLISAIKRTGGQMASAAGITAEDVIGKNQLTSGIRQWGNDVQAANPAGVTSFGDIVDKPGLYAKESLGNALPQMAPQAIGGIAGRVVGGVAGGLIGGPAGAAIGQEVVGRIGQAIPTFVQEYGGIREQQERNGVDNKLGAAAAAVPATGIEFALGPQRLLGRLLEGATTEQVKAMAKMPAKEIAKSVGKEAVKGGLGEAAEEVVQNPIEAWGEQANPFSTEAVKNVVSSPETWNDALFSGAMAIPGGGIAYGGIYAASVLNERSKQSAQDKPLAEQKAPVIPPDVSLTADPVPVQQRIDAMLGLDTARMDEKGRALYQQDLAAAFNEPIGIRLDANQNEVPYTMGEYLDSQIKIADNERAKPLRSSANQQATTRLNQLAEEEAQQHAAITQDLVRSAAQGGALSKAALTGIQTGATQMPVHPERAAIEQQMLADEAAQAELAPIERLMRTRSDEQVQRIAENENANPKMRQVAIADLQRRMATKAQPTTTSPLQQTATQLNMPAQNGIKQLQAQLEQTEPFTEQSSALTEKLQSAVTQDAQSALNAGEMPVYKVTDHVSVAIHPSAQNPGMVQVTRYTKDGVIGDSQYNNVDDAVRQEGLTHKPRIPSGDAIKAIEQSIAAEAEYQQRKANNAAQPAQMDTQAPQANGAQARVEQGAAQAVAAVAQKHNATPSNRQEYLDSVRTLGESLNNGDSVVDSETGVEFKISKGTTKSGTEFIRFGEGANEFTFTRRNGGEWSVMGDAILPAKYDIRKDSAAPQGQGVGNSVGGKSGIAKGAQGIAQRQANAANNFIDSVQEQFGLSKEEAGKAWDHFVKNKLVKIDAVGGQYSLTDGRLWDGEVMRHAASAEQQSSPVPALEEVAKRLGITINRARSGFHAASDGKMVSVPQEDKDAEGALSANHILAHELGHAIIARRGMNFSGIPIGVITKQYVPNWIEFVGASKAFRPGVWNHSNEKIRKHANKQIEVLADAIASVLIGSNPVSMLKQFMENTGTTLSDLGLQSVEEANSEYKAKKAAVDAVSHPKTDAATEAKQDKAPASNPKPSRNKIDPAKDSLFQAIAKLGGMDTQELTGNGFDQKDISVRHNGRVIQSGKNKGQLTKPSFKPRSFGFNMPLHKKGGMSFDGMLEALKQYGYFPEGATKNDAIEAFRRELGGDVVVTPDAEMRRMEEDQAARDAEQLAEQEANDAIGYDDLNEREKALVDFHAETVYDEDNPIEAFRRGMKSAGATEEEINEAIKQTFGAQETGNNDSSRAAQGTGEDGNAQGADNGLEDGSVQEGAEPDWLTGQTNEQAAEQFAQQKAAKEKEAADKKAAEDKAKADAEANDFRLAGSDRAADVAVAGGQQDIFAQPKQDNPVQSNAKSDASLARTKDRNEVRFENPYIGIGGNYSLVGYVWPNKKEEYIDRRGEDRIRTVSDWEAAVENLETGRQIVHQFAVKKSDGTEQDVSAETAAKLLGVSESTVRNNAKKQLERAIAKEKSRILEIKEADDLDAIDAQDSPAMAVSNRAMTYSKNSPMVERMAKSGESWAAIDNRIERESAGREKYRFLTKDGKFVWSHSFVKEGDEEYKRGWRNAEFTASEIWPAQPVKATTEAKAVEPWQMTQEEYVDSQVALQPNANLPAMRKYMEGVRNRASVEWGESREAAAIAGKPVKVKPAWMWTQKEWTDATGNGADEHYERVRDAVELGKPVPANVLADYPDLKPKSVEPVAVDANKQNLDREMAGFAGVSDVEYELRQLSHKEKRDGDIELGNGKFITLEQAVSAARQHMSPSDWSKPFQFNRVLDIAPVDWNTMVEAMKSVAVDAKKEEKPDDGIRYSKAQDEKFQPDEDLIDAAKRHFMVTQDTNEAGYIMPDGTMLDFSGKHYANRRDWPYLRGQRNVDHRELTSENAHTNSSIESMFEKTDGNDIMEEFMSRTGAMRVDFRAGISSIMREPTAAQLRLLGKMKGWSATSYIDPKNGRIVADVEWENTTPAKIRSFFAENVGKSADSSAPKFSFAGKSAATAPITRTESESLIKSILGDKLGKVMIESGQVMLVDTEQGLKNLPGAKYMVAWHGSPHDHNKFDSSKIGTGEGAQAYGYGLYFAGAKDVAEWYKYSTSRPELNVAGTRYVADESGMLRNEQGKTIGSESQAYQDAANALFGSKAGKPLDVLAEEAESYLQSRRGMSAKRIADAKQAILDGSVKPEPRGKLYQVELAPSEDEFLDWDKTYSEQSEFVKSALGRPNEWLKLVQAKGNRPLNGMGIYKSLADSLIEKAHVGKSGEYVSLPSDFNEEKEASDYLHSIGIRGIRYLDGSSRRAGQGNSNYVIFSDDDVTITAKYAKQNGGIQGATLPDGRIALVLENLTKDNFAGVFQHEGFHSTIKELVGQETYAKLMKQLENMHAMDKGAQWVKDANAAIPSDTKAEHRTEELAAYAIERYVNGAKQPNIITRWVESLLSALRTAIIRKLPMGKLKAWAINNLQPQDLANLAIAGLKAKAQGQLQAQGREAIAYSRRGFNENNNPIGRDTLLRSLYYRMADLYDETDSVDDAFEAIYNESSPSEQFILRELKKDDFLGFDYPHQAISAIINEPESYDLSPTLKGAISRLGNVRFSKINQTDTPAFKSVDDLNAAMLENEGIENAFSLSSLGDKSLIKAFKETFGVDVVPVKANTEQGKQFLGMNYGGKLYVNAENEHAGFVQIAGHELLHQIANDSPGIYKWFSGIAKDYLRSGAAEHYGERLKAQGENLDAEATHQEILADFVGDALADRNFLRALADNNPSKFKMFVSSVIKWLGNVANRLSGKGFESSQYFNDVNGLRGYLVGVLDAYSKTKSIPSSGAIRYSRAQIVGDSGRQYDQTQRQFFKNVGRDIEKKNLVERTTEYLKNDFWKKMAVGIVDQFRGLRDLGDNGQAYMLARLSKGTAGAFDALLHHGKLSIRDGVYDADTSGGFIERLGTPLHGELDDFLWYVAANRAEGLSKVDRENLFTPADIAAGKSLAKGQTNFDYTIQTGPQKGTTTRNRTMIYADANRVFNEFQKNTLDMAEQSGLIDGASRKLWESEFYVPFYRVSEEDGEFIGSKMGKALVRQQAFKKLKGGTDKLNSDLLSNTLLNFSHLLEASAKNRAAKASLTAAEKIGAAHRAAYGEKNTVWYMGDVTRTIPKGQKYEENGVEKVSDGTAEITYVGKVEYGVDDPFIMTAITSLEYAGMRNGVMDVMTKFKHWLTIGVTASPAFKVRNLIRDSIQSIGASDLSYSPIKNIAEGYKQTKRDSQEYVSALASGGLIRFGTMLEGSESSRVRQLVKSGVKDSTILNSENKWRAFYDQYLDPAVSAYNELGNRSEEINRAALYNQLIKQGKSHAEAALLARDLMDFSMQGSFNTIRFLTQVVPFMNARLQGMYKLGRAAKDNPRKLAVVTGAVALASIALMLAYGDDDDWKRREDWDRDGFWWFKFGGVEFRVPKPFEVGAIGSLAERGLELMIDDEMTGERFRRVVNSLVMNNLSMNPLPQAFKPILDLYSNKDSFTGRPIESMGMQRLDPTERFNSNTSMIARGMSNASFGALSPVQIDHLARAYFGWLGSFVIGGADMAFRGMSDQPTKPALDYFKFGTQGILKEAGTGSSRYVTQVYEQAKELEQAHATYRQMIKDGRIDEAKDYAADNQDKMIRYRQVEAVKKVESNLNERIRKIERSDMDSGEKKDAIALINKQKEQVAKRITAGAS